MSLRGDTRFSDARLSDARFEDTRLSRGALALSKLVTLSAMGLSVLAFFGWFADLAFLRQLLPGQTFMHPISALVALVVAVGILLGQRAPADKTVRRSLLMFGHVLALLALLASLLVLAGHLLAVDELRQPTHLLRTNWLTALVLALLATAYLLSQPEQGIMVLLTSAGPGGVLVRRLVPAAVVIPLTLGWLRVTGERLDWFDTELGTLLFVLATMMLFHVLTWSVSQKLEGIEGKRLEAEETIRTLNNELAQRVVERTAELETANHELSEKNQENELFVYSVSHDLRSPLVNLQGFSRELSATSHELRELFQHADIPDATRLRGLELIDREMAECLHFISTGVMRLSNIIDGLLRLSRAGRVEYVMQSLDMNKIIERIIDSNHETIRQKGVHLTVQDLPPAFGDATAIEQVFANLIGNALNYLDPGRKGALEIGYRPPRENGAAGEYYVKDNGLGIADAFRSKAFQAFQRLHPEAASGEGMGLAIVKRALDRHRGKITLDSKPGAGSTFYVTLPAAAVDKPASVNSSNARRLTRESTKVAPQEKTVR